MQFIGLFLSAIVVEGMISYSKLLFVDKKFQWQNIIAIILGIFVSVIYQIDIFGIVGLTPLIPYVGTVLTGILISRGSNYIYEIIKKITNFPQKVLYSNEGQSNDADAFTSVKHGQ